MTEPDWIDKLASHYGDALVLVGLTPDGGGGATFEFFRALSAAEADRYRRAHSRIGEKALAFQLIDFLIDNLADAESAVRAIGVRSPDQTSRAGRGHARAANRTIINYLTAVRLYLDHTHARLRRTYGAGSNPLEAFGEATRAVHESAPVYPFVYKLRNYVQHCGMPLQVVRRSDRIVPDGQGGEQTESETFVGCNRDQLLANYDSWGANAKAFISAQSNEFELMPILKQFDRELEQVQKAVWIAETKELWSDILFVVRLCNEVCTEARRAEVVQVQRRPDGEALTLQQYSPPFGTLSQLDLIREHPITRGWVVKQGPHLTADIELVLR